MTQEIKTRFELLKPFLNERMRRLWAAAEARAIGNGGITLVSEVTGLSRSTIRAGLGELDSQPMSGDETESRVQLRRSGGGRKSLVDREPSLLSALEGLIDPVSHGRPVGPLRWTCKSTSALANALKAQGYAISPRTVNRLLHDLGYRLPPPAKQVGGRASDREAQFRHIDQEVKAFQRRGQPVVSVDVRKKERVDPCRHDGLNCPKGQPSLVRANDMLEQEVSKVVLDELTDIANDTPWRSVEADDDTVEFAAETLQRWWLGMGRPAYRRAKRLLIIATGIDAGGDSRRQWELKLQALADALGVQISGCYLPAGTSRWSTMQHQMAACTDMKWPSRPFTHHEIVVSLISHTTTSARPESHSEVDKGSRQP